MAAKDKDRDKARRRAQEQYTQICIRIKTQKALVHKLKSGNDPVAWDDASRQLKKLEERQQEILRRMR